MKTTLIMNYGTAACWICLCWSTSQLTGTAGFSLSQVQTSRRSSSLLYASDDDDDAGMDEDQRMEMVRSLQKSFYSSTDETSVPRFELEQSTGIMTNLPLWRVGWVEVPGRANCLNVHEGQYTHMFETILNGPKPWYVGHLHLPGGFKMARTGQRRFDLKSWRDEIQDKPRYQETERSAVVGTLMRITDYRRLEDGRLCLLVHDLERFVVDKVVQSFPYSVADVQILPDREELPEGLVDENFGKMTRGAAVRRSFEYHEYEFDNVQLPMARDADYLPTDNIEASEISRLLPFAFYSSDDSSLDGISEETPSSSEDSGFSGGEPLLEDQLESWRILQNPPLLPGGDEPKTADLDVLETLLWLAVESLCHNTGFLVPEEVRCLLPPHMDYLDIQPAKRPVSPKYPAYRRQRRLSYALPAILESTNLGADMRQTWLNTPSTRARLAAVLGRLEHINDTLLGSSQWE
jgi:Lon protease-like protein